MAFPDDPLPVAVDLLIGGTWTDITTDVLVRAGIGIERGRSDEGARADVSKCALTLNNADGTYSPRNPSSPHYGLIGRNTPIRVAIEDGEPYLAVDGTAADRATTPDAAALDITGDIDVRVEVTPASWHSNFDMAGKYETTGNQRSWAFYLHADGSGTPCFTWSPDGTATIDAVATAEAPAPPGGRQALRATLDVDNGAGGWTCTFYYSDAIGGTWTQLGDPVTGAGTTSVFSGSAVVEVGDIVDLAAAAVTGKVHAFQLLDGIGGAVVADVDFTAQTPGDTSFADSQGLTWTLQGGASISDRRYRFHGEISSWPPRWDVTGTDVWTPVEAAGILRRLGQGSTVQGSVMYRALTRDAESVVAYWPMEDAEGAKAIAAASPDTAPMQIIGTPTMASFEGFAASAPLPVLAGAEFKGAVPAYTATGEVQVRFLLAVPSGGAETGQTLVVFYCTGTAARWEVYYETGGLLGLRAFDSEGASLLDTGGIAFAVDGELLRVSVELGQDGADIDYNLLTLEVGASSGLSSSGTLSSQTLGRAGVVQVSPGGGIDEVTIGHLSVQDTITTLFDLASQLNAWRGERAGARIERLCSEEGIAFTYVGDLGDTVMMGEQSPAGLLDLLQECADADMGILYEPRDQLGLGYRTRRSLYNQAAAVELDYDAKHLSPPLEPTDDDQQVRNDITVQRDDGSSARAVLESGPLSTAAAPDGVGRYDEQVTVNVRFDEQLADQAGWRLHVGTVDEARYPQISVNMANSDVAGDATLSAALPLVDVGDRVTIDNQPAWLPPDLITQLVWGVAERLEAYGWDIGMTCVPESPYQVAVYDSGRYSAESSTLAEDLTTVETDVSVATATGPLWTTEVSEFPFDILVGGERMTVTGISGSSSPQVFTVTRSVNGVAKAHSSGDPVRLFTPAIRAL